MVADHKTECLRSMMRVYESPRHTVVAVGVRHGDVKYIGSGTQVMNVPPEECIFEIGSITKVFTAILLCLLVEEGKVDPRAPLRDVSGDLADVPGWITPESLTTHTSGLPNLHLPLWKALFTPFPEGPYTAFSQADLMSWLRNWHGSAPRRKPRHVYSNLGVGLLGEAMAMREGKPFVDLLVEKVTGPLGLRDTNARLDPDQRMRFVQPRSPNGRAILPWSFAALAGAGCLRSSGRDLARFASRVIEALIAPESELDRAICRSARPIIGLGRRGAMEPTAQCSGWLALKPRKADPGFIFHNGGTAGSSCALYICPEKEQACIILSNNGIAGHLWGSAKLSLSNQPRQANDFFRAA